MFDLLTPVLIQKYRSTSIKQRSAPGSRASFGSTGPVASGPRSKPTRTTSTREMAHAHRCERLLKGSALKRLRTGGGPCACESQYNVAPTDASLFAAHLAQRLGAENGGSIEFTCRQSTHPPERSGPSRGCSAPERGSSVCGP